MIISLIDTICGVNASWGTRIYLVIVTLLYRIYNKDNTGWMRWGCPTLSNCSQSQCSMTYDGPDIVARTDLQQRILFWTLSCHYSLHVSSTARLLSNSHILTPSKPWLGQKCIVFPVFPDNCQSCMRLLSIVFWPHRERTGGDGGIFTADMLVDFYHKIVNNYNLEGQVKQLGGCQLARWSRKDDRLSQVLGWLYNRFDILSQFVF